jgi:nanoRNase/pAp phosphatase (c-di-AMP/oligoRNAs hydrolase)
MNWDLLKELIDEHQSFLITSHVRPDADALGSELGMHALLSAFGKDVTIVNASAPPATLQFMNQHGIIRKLNENISKADIPQTDAIVIVDTSAWQQLGNMAGIVQSSTAQRIVIDHHVSSDRLEAREFKDVSAAATGELIFEACEALDVPINPETAAWLYAAIATDTGWFRFPSTTARTMRVVTELVRAGAVPHQLYHQIHEQSSLARLQLKGRVLSRVRTEADGRLVWIYVNEEDLKLTGAAQSDSEGLVNQCLTLAGSEAAFIAVEMQTGQIKFSLRCREPHNVAAVAETFQGGGHRLASGVTLNGPLATGIDQIRTAMLKMLAAESTSETQPVRTEAAS